MGDIPTPSERALVRAAAEDILDQSAPHRGVGRERWERTVREDWERQRREAGPDSWMASVSWEGYLSQQQANQDRLRQDYRQMARGTLAALDWLEGRCLLSPSRGKAVRPGDVIELPPWRSLTPEMDRALGIPPRQEPRQSTELVDETDDAERWGSGHVRPPTEDMHYHGAVWALLRWWRHPTSKTRRLAIDVPGLFDSF
ncbi:hypothetical protein [Pseudonocardia sp. ICBG162]|uniref:hypothetical protein n=1 Tax=Pseudonocardia sp. ICBG162 TaxID=2846761 RepID=UPI001CF6BE36|nr:hypothetical protein [Pseudonocardia sp. ICBG162]